MIRRRRSRRSPRVVLAGILSLAFVGLALTGEGGVTETNASWNDAEWAYGGVGAVDCSVSEGEFATRGEGRALSGSLLGIDLDSLAQAGGVETTNNGSRSTVSPAGANPVPGEPDAYADPLNVQALSTVNVDLGQGILKLPLDNSTGVLGQYGQAGSSGASRGASGYVTETGGIGLDPGTGYPDLASLSLSQLLQSVNPAVAGLLENVSDVSLEAGAVSGRAEIDGCALAWADAEDTETYAAALADNLAREYLASSVTTEVSSPTVGALVTDVNSIVSTLNSTVPNLVNNTVLRNGIIGAINGIVSPLLGTLGLGSTTIDTFTIGIDLSPVTELVQATITDTGGIVAVNLGAGTISVDTSALLEAAYAGTDGTTLNGLAPNTDLLGDPRILNTLTDALTGALSQWVTQVAQALTAALDGISIKLTASVGINLIVVPVAKITIGVDASLATLAAGGGVTATAEILGSINLTLLNSILSALTSGLGPPIAGLVRGLLPTVASLVANLSTLTGIVVSTVSNVYDVLFLDGIVSLTVNAQNDPASGSPEPADWAGLEPGRYDVAALRIGVLGALAQNDVHLYLGRGSVGPGCSMASAAGGACAGY